MHQKRLNPGAVGTGARKISSEQTEDDLPTSGGFKKPAGLSEAEVAIEFLKKLRPGGPWTITAIVPDGSTITKTFYPDGENDLNAFIETHDGKCNIYYSVNLTRKAMSKKASKTDIAAVEYLLADLDPGDDETPEAAKSRYLEALETHEPAPTAIIDSGNGIQALWKLDDPIKLAEPGTIENAKAFLPETAATIADVEARTASLMKRLGSVAGTQNIDRILRLPGTTNLPNKNKTKEGRVACAAKLIEFNSKTCKIEDFPAETAPAATALAEKEPGRTTEPKIDWAEVERRAGWLKTVADLPRDFNAKGKIIVENHGTIKDLNNNLKQAGLVEKAYGSWSDVSFALAAIFKADGRYTPEQIIAALMCDLECNKHVTKLNDTNKRRAVERLLSRSHAPPTQRGARILNWRECRANGSPVASMYNVRLGIVAMGIECRHDVFRDVTLIGFQGDEVVHELKPLIGELTNAALLRLRHEFSMRFGFDPEDKHVLDAVKTLAFENCFDPVLDTLDTAQGAWDGVPRLDEMVVKYFGCEDTLLNRAIGRKALIAAAHRARTPGCKFDNIVVLESPEGFNKSTAIRILAGDQYFSDQSILGARDKEVQEQLGGVWMHENADLAGMKRAEVEHVKAFASRQVDIARPAYGRAVERRHRRSVEWASTNNSEYLQSQTGNRRFWPLAVGRIDIDALRRDRLQLLGEAATYEAKGESVVLDEALWPDAALAQEERRAKDPWEDIVANIPVYVSYECHSNRIEFIRLKEGEKARSGLIRILHQENDREVAASADLLKYVMGIPIERQKTHDSMRLATVMKLAGWERDSNKISIDGKQVRGYFRRVEG